MSKSMGAPSRLVKNLTLLGTVVSGLSLISMVVLILSEIAMRAFFSASMYVLNELVAYCMVTMTFAGLGFALQEEKLIRVGFVLNLFGESRFWTRTLELTNFFAAAVALSFFEYYLVLSASRDFWRGTNSGTMLETPKWLPQSIAALMIFVFLWLLLTRIVGLLMMFIRDRRGGIAT